MINTSLQKIGPLEFYPLDAEKFQPANPQNEGVLVEKTDRIDDNIPSVANQHAKSPNYGTIIKEIIDIVHIPTDDLYTYAAEPYLYFEPFLNLRNDAKNTLNQVVTSIEIAGTALQGVDLISNSVELAFQSAHFQRTKNLLKTKEIELKQNPSQELKKKVDKLHQSLFMQWEALKEKILYVVSLFLSFSLYVASFVIYAIKGIIPLIKSASGWALYLLDVINQSIDLWRTQKAKTTYETWMTQVTQDARSFDQAKMLLAKRQERMILRKAEKITFQELTKILLEKNIDLAERKINSFNDFKAKLSEPDFRKEIVTNFIHAEDEREDTINVMTRNGIQALAETKVKNEETFVDVKLVLSKISLVLASLSLVSTIVLEVLAVIGVITTTPWALTALGFFVLGWMLVGVGLFFFYKQRPQLFKCYLRGVSLRLRMAQLPAKIRQSQLSKVKEEIETLKMRDRRDSYLKKLHSYHRKEQELNEKVKYWASTITNLQNQLTEAGIQDFALKNKLQTTTQNKKIDIPLDLTEKIFDPKSNFDFDDETLKILKERMSINLPPQRKIKKEALVAKIKEFLNLDEDELLPLMKLYLYKSTLHQN